MNKSILYGVLCLAIGIGCIYVFIWRPLEGMALGKDDIYYSLKGVGIGPFLVLFGIYLLIFRPPNMKPAEMLPKHRLMYWVVIGVSIVIGILAFLWFKHQATALGYTL